MAVAEHSENIELQEEDANYENDTAITARRIQVEMSAEGLYDRLDLQNADDAVYEDLQIKTQKEKDLEKMLQSVIAVAVCLGMLCLLLLGGNIGQAVHYHSPINSMTNDTLVHDYNQLKSNYDNLTLENTLLKTKYNNLTREKNQLTTNNNNLRKENEQLKTKLTLVENDKSCPSGWTKFGSSCYYKSTEKTTWEESRKQCQQGGADLVIINSREEQEFIRWSNQQSWIGLKRTEGRWTWLDGTAVTTPDWVSGFPDNAKDRNCAVYFPNTGWYNERCSDGKRHHICEK